MSDIWAVANGLFWLVRLVWVVIVVMVDPTAVSVAPVAVEVGLVGVLELSADVSHKCVL